MGGQLADATGSHQPPVPDDSDTVAELLDQFELVAGEHHRHTRGGLLAQHLTHHVDGYRIESRERFVQYQYRRLTNQRRRQLHALLVTETEFLQPILAPCLQTERRVQFVAFRCAALIDNPCNRAKYTNWSSTVILGCKPRASGM